MPMSSNTDLALRSAIPLLMQGAYINDGDIDMETIGAAIKSIVDDYIATLSIPGEE